MSYLLIVGIFVVTNMIAALGLNLQLGFGGIVNLAFILFFACGAYFTAVFTIGPPGSSQDHLLAQTYLFGARFPWPFPLIVGVLATIALGYVVARLLFRNERDDFAGLAAVAIFLICWNAVGDWGGLFNGWNGLSAIPQLYQSISQGGYESQTEMAVYLGVCVVFAVGSYWYCQRLILSPFGRSLKAVRENRAAASALGINPNQATRKAFIIGCALAGLSGGLFVQGATVWSPSTWALPETVALIAAVILGGRGNNFGSIMGIVFFQGVLNEGAHLIPGSAQNGNLIAATQWIVISLTTVLVLWARPAGIFPERKRIWPKDIDRGLERPDQISAESLARSLDSAGETK